MWWLARGEDAVPAHPRWLAPDEAARAAGLRFTKRRAEYLLRRLTAKCAVAAVAGLPRDAESLARVAVRNAPTGAPFVLLDGAPSGFEISISDRAGWAVCLVSPAGSAGPVGCDLELIEPRSAGFLRDFLTDAERAHVAAQPDGGARHVAANLLWSAKESALKVLGTGLRRDTRGIEVSLPDRPDGPDGDWAALAVRADDGPTFAGWWRRDGRFLLTVAAAAPVPAPVALEDPPALAAGEPRHSWLVRPLTD
jgi:4'-phosphopantetheinyl transferase